MGNEDYQKSNKQPCQEQAKVCLNLNEPTGEIVVHLNGKGISHVRKKFSVTNAGEINSLKNPMRDSFLYPYPTNIYGAPFTRQALRLQTWPFPSWSVQSAGKDRH